MNFRRTYQAVSFKDDTAPLGFAIPRGLFYASKVEPRLARGRERARARAYTRARVRAADLPLCFFRRYTLFINMHAYARRYTFAVRASFSAASKYGGQSE